MRRGQFVAQRLETSSSAPPVLQEDMRCAVRLLDDVAARPSKYFAGVDQPVLQAWQRDIADYGELLVQWPELRRFVSTHPDAWRAHVAAEVRPAARPAMPASAPAVMKFECPFCGWRLARFLPHGHHHDVLATLRVVGGGRRPHAVCPMCLSMDRERLVYLYLRHHSRILQLRGRLLHLAPERRLGWWLASMPAIQYISGDLAPRRVACRMDVTRLPLPDGSIDVVVCNHVLEHVRDDASALAELRRVLKPSGFAVLQVPIGLALNETREDPTANDPDERERVFGQADHVRIYGRDYPQRLTRAGFDCRIYDPEADLGIDAVRRFGLIEGERLFAVRKRS